MSSRLTTISWCSDWMNRVIDPREFQVGGAWQPGGEGMQAAHLGSRQRRNQARIKSTREP